jgi:putative ABC transport system ATP-binding protein
MIQIEDLWKCYDEDCSDTTAALRGLSMAVSRGETVALFGRSGSGKTTLFNLIAGLDRPTRGTILFEGRSVHDLTELQRTWIRRSRIGFVFQSFNLIPTLSALENILLPIQMLGLSPHHAQETLSAVGLTGKERRFPHELSGGEQQRVAIARALVKEPALILADEPTGNLDTDTGDQILDLVRDLCTRTGTTLLMATHSIRASRITERVLTISDGRIEESEEAGRP